MKKEGKEGKKAKEQKEIKVWERYSRQILFPPIGREGQKLLLKSKAAIIGLGALGTVTANSLARAGVGTLKLVDRDIVDKSNLQRQILFTEEDAEKMLPKAQAAGEKLCAINSEIKYEIIVEDVNYTNIMEIIGDVQVVFDATDNLETRFLINEACVKENIPWIHGACLGSSGFTFTILPGKTACLACYMGELPQPGNIETCDTAGIISPAVNIVASLQVCEGLKLLTKNISALNPKALYFDLWENLFTEFKIDKSDQCSICGKRSFELLSGKLSQQGSSLCGRNMVQILPLNRQTLSLEKLKERLEPLGEVRLSKFLLKFSIDGFELMVFPDGRALVSGTSDIKKARSLYARYIGV